MKHLGITLLKAPQRQGEQQGQSETAQIADRADPECPYCRGVGLIGGDPQGQVFPPNVLVDVTNHMPVTRDETFGARPCSAHRD